MSINTNDVTMSDNNITDFTNMGSNRMDLIKKLQMAVKTSLQSAAAIPEGEDFYVLSTLPQFRSNMGLIQKKLNSCTQLLINFIMNNEGGGNTEDEIPFSINEEVLDYIFAVIDDLLAGNNPLMKRRRKVFLEEDDGGDESRIMKDLIGNIPDKSQELLFGFKPNNFMALPSPPYSVNPYEDQIKKCLRTVIKKFETDDLCNFVPELPKIEYLDESRIIHVNTLVLFERLLDDLSTESFVSIDLEHHSQCSYRGFTCLIQISSSTTDYIVDPFPLWSHIHLLNRITTDANIVKIMHGADSDVMWLQRDFRIFLVNLFDTSQAARILNTQGGRGLANLLKVYCNVIANKKFQLADWRKRPLSREKIKYAAEDTHYLKFIYLHLVKELLTAGMNEESSVVREDNINSSTSYGRKMITNVLEASFGLSLRIYKEEYPYNANLHANKILRNHRSKDDKKTILPYLEGILEWRDALARHLNVCTGTILPDKASVSLAHLRPESVENIRRDLMSNGFPIALANADEIFKHITNKKSSSLIDDYDMLLSSTASQILAKKNINDTGLDFTLPASDNENSQQSFFTREVKDEKIAISPKMLELQSLFEHYDITTKN